MHTNFSVLLRSLLWFLLAAILIGAAVVAGFSILPNLDGRASLSPTPPVAAASTLPAIPPGWKVYSDPDAGFSFSYPPRAVLETGKNDLHPYNFIRLVFSEPAQASLIVDVRANSAKSTPAELAAQLYQEAASQAAPKAVWVNPLRGSAEIQFTKPAVKVSKDMIVTTITVKNVSAGPIARLTIEEFWYDKSGNPVTGDKKFLKKPLMPGEMATITLETPKQPNMDRNSYKFSHANGTVKPKKVTKF